MPIAIAMLHRDRDPMLGFWEAKFRNIKTYANSFLSTVSLNLLLAIALSARGAWPLIDLIASWYRRTVAAAAGYSSYVVSS